jgi:hypothetical protein
MANISDGKWNGPKKLGRYSLIAHSAIAAGQN